MANIDDLVDKPLSELSDDELIERLRQIRQNRRQPPKRQAKKKAKKMESATDKQSMLSKVKDLTKNMTDEQKQAFLKEMGII